MLFLIPFALVFGAVIGMVIVAVIAVGRLITGAKRVKPLSSR